MARWMRIRWHGRIGFFVVNEQKRAVCCSRSTFLNEIGTERRQDAILISFGRSRSDRTRVSCDRPIRKRSTSIERKGRFHIQTDQSCSDATTSLLRPARLREWASTRREGTSASKTDFRFYRAAPISPLANEVVLQKGRLVIPVVR